MKSIINTATQNIDLQFIQNAYKILDWDSNFFDFKVCKIKSNNLSDIELAAVLAYLYTFNVKLIYYSTEQEIPNNAKKIRLLSNKIG